MVQVGCQNYKGIFFFTFIFTLYPNMAKSSNDPHFGYFIKLTRKTLCQSERLDIELRYIDYQFACPNYFSGAQG
jgi:hypothetical protein